VGSFHKIHNFNFSKREKHKGVTQMNDTYITVHKPCKGWSIQLIEFDIDFNEMMPSSNYPNGDLLEYACETEASAINEGLRTARDLELAFKYTTTEGIDISNLVDRYPSLIDLNFEVK